MARPRADRAELGEQIRARLADVELEYLEGAGVWTARSIAPATREELVARLVGLPVDVASDDRFDAI
jgi:hypothetical protein